MTLQISKKRYQLYGKIRDYFHKQNVLEVQTPCLSRGTLIDEYIHPLEIDDFYLQTSPELQMKRLLSRGYPSIYQIFKAFRKEEEGKNHRVEFSLLEWYRVDWAWDKIASEVATIIQLIKPNFSVVKMTYQQAFLQYVNLCPFESSIVDLKNKIKDTLPSFPLLFDRDDIITTLFNQVVVPCFDFDKVTIVSHYPASQANLAKISPVNPSLSLRFEVFCAGLEMANGFEELTKASQYQKCFARESNKRKKHNLPILSIDQDFLVELEKRSLPFCSGVALGLDRLMMILLDTKDIQNVLEF